MASRWRRRDAIEASTSTQAPPANAWAAPPGLQPAPPEPPKANAWAAGAPLSARTTGASAGALLSTRTNSTSSSESIKFVGTRKPETADERAQTAMMLALRAWGKEKMGENALNYDSRAGARGGLLWR